MTDAELMLTVESRKKSGWLAALLNFFIPGGGYLYCGNWFLAIMAIGFLVMAFVALGPLGVVVAGSFQILFVIDGFLCAGRYNKRMISRTLTENRTPKTA